MELLLKKSVWRPRVAIMGTRGVPASYGGFETFAEELGSQLVARGYPVTVYGRRYLSDIIDDNFSDESRYRKDWYPQSKYPQSSYPQSLYPETLYRGIRCRKTFTLRHKYLDTPLAAFSSLVDVAMRGDTDVIILCNAATSPFACIPRLAGIPTAINVDGIERKRTKWSSIGRAWYRLGEWCSVQFASVVVTDALVIKQYYCSRYDCDSTHIDYGALEEAVPSGDILAKFGLVSGAYLLYVGRLEPENNALGVIQAYVASGLEMPLVVVGDAPYASSYKKLLREAANDKVIFTGYQFGAAYRELRTHPALYIQASEVGGTHPALLEAMVYGNAIVANGVPEHYEVLGGAGAYYQKNDFSELADLLPRLLSNAELLGAYRHHAKIRAKARYSWDSITDKYEELIWKLLTDSKARARQQ